MTSSFKIIEARTHAEIDRYGVREFAAEFGHKPVGLPLLLFFHEDDLVAYVEVRSLPFLLPAVHPKVTSRIFLEGGRLLKKIVEEKYPNGFVLYDYRSAHFAAGLMQHLGFSESPLRFFEAKEDPLFEIKEDDPHGSQSPVNSEV